MSSTEVPSTDDCSCIHFNATELDRFPLSRPDPIRDTLALVLAGGEGTRLQPLTRWRCKPSVPFGGNYRLIDFTLSNCINSGIRQIGVLVQYKSQSLISHLQKGWDIFNSKFNEYIEILPAQQQNGKKWYKGTADAIYQNLALIKSRFPEYVLVAAGDHIYKSDYRRMIEYHIESGADMTIGCIEVPLANAQSFGIMETGPAYVLNKFIEKPADLKPDTGSTDMALASMGIYVFHAEFLYRILESDAINPESSHDFGNDIIPSHIATDKLVAYPFSRAQQDHYWKDVGTLDAYYAASMDLIDVYPEVDLYDSKWPIWTLQHQLPPTKFVTHEDSISGYASDSIVSAGCVISGAGVRRSILHSGVRIDHGSTIERTIVMPGVCIGKNCRIRNAVIEECCHVPDGSVIGYNIDSDRERFHITENGVSVICADMIDNPIPAISVTESIEKKVDRNICNTG